MRHVLEGIMENKWRICRRVISDVLALSAVLVSVILLRLYGKPYQRGFFCDDETLQYPYHESTVPAYVLYIVSFSVGCTMIFTLETLGVCSQCVEMESQQHDIRRYGRLPIIIRNIYLSMVPFLFGAFMEYLIMYIGKYSIGRLRPHFFAVCNISTSQLQCSSGYIEDFECVSDDGERAFEARLSFPSGHSSVASYSAVYIIIYLQKRLKTLMQSLICPLLQTALFCCAWFTCLSRISDYKHHPTDVLAGALLGSLSAVIVAYGVSDLFNMQDTRADSLRPYNKMNHNGETRTENPDQDTVTAF